MFLGYNNEIKKINYMTIDEAINVLELHNKWRKGADIEMQTPTMIGMAIDLVVCELKNIRGQQTPSTSIEQDIKEIVIKEYEKGNIVIDSCGELMSVRLTDFIDALADEILYDLNRDEATILTFIDNPKWINDFATARVIRALKDRIDELENQLKNKQKMNEILKQLKQYFDNTSEEDIKKEWDAVGRSCKDVDPKDTPSFTEPEISEKDEWIRREVTDYDWENEGFGDSSIEELLSKGYERGYNDAMKLMAEAIKALRNIAEGLYPSSADEAFIFAGIAKKIADDALNKILNGNNRK